MLFSSRGIRRKALIVKQTAARNTLATMAKTSEAGCRFWTATTGELRLLQNHRGLPNAQERKDFLSDIGSS